jgi:flagellar hook-associated protein 1 FlgK
VSLGKLLNTARDALSAQAFGLTTTGQNIANASTPGYVRRSAILQTRPNIGGVVATGVSRGADAFIDRRWIESSSLASSSSERETQLSGIESLFADNNGNGIGSAVGALFQGFEALTANPSDPTTRNMVLSRASGLATRFRDVATNLATRREELFRSAKLVADQTNSTAESIGKLNQQIQMSENMGNDASDLRDQRDQKLLELSSYVDVKTFTDGSGKFVVVAAGTTLVEGNTAGKFQIGLAGDGSLEFSVLRGTAPATKVTSLLSGGKLDAIQEVRDKDLVAIEGDLDDLAWSVGNALNAQHALGFGTDGVNGRPLFVMSATADGAARAIALDPAMEGHPERVAASSTSATLPGGSGNALALATIADLGIASGGTRTAAEAWSDFVGSVGVRVADAMRNAETRGDIHAQNEAAREAQSGVSLDEEMVKLTQYQRAYEANAKVLNTVDELLRELMNRIGS